MLYFTLSSEIMENISAIKVVSTYSEMIWYHFTVVVVLLYCCLTSTVNI